ncbi:MAG: hypothetical protein A2509_07585 [Candidatus Edwardsbacteria bacterium RIFOXYD12_FULL_50_11]|uniref:Uncharacterized protein n=1 Tax=Candidatus Edwardsbacteria bacterium GWF2_54_11 TaxID=1817851 RepID=A0A1F5RE07_9BACT|nr:MAG: hypothetical protein A2273_09930 [Candidatus Edwardsbacteria bacterium RifOxyA12_full_54_48]OGF12676.1 MAG: hypothetical protein A2024_00395 [Candidatus Edwardsbacteria bacterium GWF2_54_11]OGF17135.1 MAG: hypothetical protein A2509_07585 [Candidatus Edwardsbacteria bacterium RIFOXYD12_FULL_50_11]OGJ18334.1 MAG: hypothetical protein A2349_11775 [Candidatus Edwardsbacteria bacterium RifOxyB12_full_52_30]HAD81252.1 hypothetical protein [Candidatus Edwardsbacteria bacterium]
MADQVQFDFICVDSDTNQQHVLYSGTINKGLMGGFTTAGEFSASYRMGRYYILLDRQYTKELRIDHSSSGADLTYKYEDVRDFLGFMGKVALAVKLEIDGAGKRQTCEYHYKIQM